MLHINDKLLTTLMSTASSTQIKSSKDMPKNTKDVVNVRSFHSLLLMRGRVSSRVSYQPKDSDDGKKVDFFVRTLTGENISIHCSLTENVEYVKQIILEREGIPPEQQMLRFAGKQMEDGKTLASYNVQKESVLHLILRTRAGDDVWLYLDPQFRSPQFDFDFRNIKDDGVTYYRGRCEYRRPIGTVRIALNVIDQYGDNGWLGVNGRLSRTDDVPGEWPVSYHGTGKNSANSGFLLSKCIRHAFGYGIYSTPDIKVAMRYAETFIHENEKYKFIVQNRVNPETVRRVPASETRDGEYWICEKEEDIRPYGFCYMKC